MSLNLNFDANEINVLLAGLGELPAKTSFAIINKVKYQAEAQMAAQAANPPVVEQSPEKPELLVEAK